MRPISRPPLKPRPTPTRKYSLIIIGAEGKTEVEYFKIFNSSRLQVITLGPGEENRSAPQQALERLCVYRDENRTNGQIIDGDSFWLMVDADKAIREKKEYQLHDVCREARQRGIELALSNPCFEVWLLLHHADADATDTDCAAVKRRITLCRGQGQSKTNIDPANYLPNITAAVDRARLLDTNPASAWPDHPGTHVYKVAELLG